MVTFTIMVRSMGVNAIQHVPERSSKKYDGYQVNWHGVFQEVGTTIHYESLWKVL